VPITCDATIRSTVPVPSGIATRLARATGRVVRVPRVRDGVAVVVEAGDQRAEAATEQRGAVALAAAGVEDPGVRDRA
jgi:hypothetical protein